MGETGERVPDERLLLAGDPGLVDGRAGPGERVFVAITTLRLDLIVDQIRK